MAFALYSRMSGELDEENSLALSSILNQARNWAKSGLTVMQYSRSIDDYEHILSTFYSNHPKFQPLAPGYLMIFMDDHHGMEADALYNLHEHSLQGFRL